MVQSFKHLFLHIKQLKPMKHILVLVCTFLVAMAVKAQSQTLNYDDVLPVDKTIKKGVLPNGMTYYIKNTDVVKGAASYYIIQNVGSILENDNQQGLAHFLEHMAFNGTENFPGKGILDTLQKHGAVFGKDINAYTSFDETVYNLNHIPTKEGLIDICLTILRDWSNYLLLTDEEIDAERGVIKEEWRTGQNGHRRLYTKSAPVTYNHSKYAHRMPIGLMTVVEGFKYKALRDFYHEWYRTDLQAIAVIGDFDSDEMEQKIIAMFSNIPAIENPKERYIVDIPENTEMGFSFGTDPEVSSASIHFGIRHKKSLKDETVADLKRDLLQSMAVGMLANRISEIEQKPEAPFLAGRVGYTGLTRTSNYFYMSVYPKPNQQKEAFNDVLTEVIRAVKFGFLPSEIDRAIVDVKSRYENNIAKREDKSHAQIQQAIQNNFLSNQTITDVEKEYGIVQQIFKDITPKELHQTIIELYGKHNRFLNIIGVEGQDNLTEAEAKEVIQSAENNHSLQPYTEDLAGKTLVSGLDIASGKIKETTYNEALGSTTYKLSNGITVNYKFVDKEKDKVSMQAISYGGTSLLPDEDLPSASLVGNLVQMSGLGEFTAADLKKVLAGKTANLSIDLSEIGEALSGSSNTKDVETMLQMAHVYFVKPRFDADAFKVLKNNVDNYLIRKSKNVNAQMHDSLIVAVYGKNNPRERVFDQDYANAISFEKMKRIYNDRFADASDFEFFIVGDVKEDQLKPLLERYMASLPTKNTKEHFNNNTAEWVSNRINKSIFLAMEDPKANVNVVYKKEMPFSRKNVIYTNALGDILQLRVTETVREAEGGAYSPRAGASFVRQPKSVAVVSFNFDCNPDMADKLVNVVNAELQKIANGIINDDDLNKIRTNFLKEHEQAKDKNGFDMQLLTKYFRFNENINNPDHFENIVKNMDKSDIQNITKQVLNSGKSYQVVFKPKQ